LKEIFSGQPKDYPEYKSLLLSAYEFMGNLNNHLSIPPNVFKKYNIHELFGSPLNTSNPYCSPFKIEVDYFSSGGSFFDYKIKPGISVANPPFDEILAEKMVKRLD
jgi:hypothetical protein